jgi:hypothetical protein
VTSTAVAPLPLQLTQVKEELVLACARACVLCTGLDEARWAWRPSPARWSVGECLTHLNITSEQFIPLLDQAIRDGRARSVEGRPPFGLGLVGWALLKFIEPPYRMKTKTAPAFEPARLESMAATLDRFDYLQQEVQARIDRSAGLALDRLTLISPFDGRVKYNLYAAFRLIAAHQRRHLWQAEQTVRLTIAD